MGGRENSGPPTSWRHSALLEPEAGTWSPELSLRGRCSSSGPQSKQLRAGTHLGVVLCSGEEGQLIGCGEVGPNLLHLPKAFPLPPLGPPVLEPDLQDRAVVAGVRPGAGAPVFRAAPALPSSPSSCSYKVKTVGLQITHLPWSLCSRADHLEGSTLTARKAVYTPVLGATSGQKVHFLSFRTQSRQVSHAHRTRHQSPQQSTNQP